MTRAKHPVAVLADEAEFYRAQNAQLRQELGAAAAEVERLKALLDRLGVVDPGPGTESRRDL